MGRKRTRNLTLPPNMRARQRGKLTHYYYDTGGKPRKEIPLGNSYPDAIIKWAELHKCDRVAPEVIMFRHAWERYLADVVPTKSKATQHDNKREAANLLKFFDNPPAPIRSIRAMHIRAYLDWRTDRGKRATVRANRERALFSHIWNRAAEWGWVDGENPCKPVDGYSEEGRDVFVEDEVFNAVWKAADQPLRDAMDLAHLTGQRPSDVRKMDLRDLRDGVVHVKQGKTGTKRRIEVVGELAALIERIAARKRELTVHSTKLIVDEDGHPMGEAMLRSRFDRARKLAKVPKEAFQFRDLRAKAATEVSEDRDMRAAQSLLGHSRGTMTEHYVRNRRGDKVKPTR